MLKIANSWRQGESLGLANIDTGFVFEDVDRYWPGFFIPTAIGQKIHDE
ncbi:MAG: hypothetical protein OSB45_09390 [Pseudomonadales bacterium]|nr:hypothetical protein [Pseudomonadales bacterium]